jgi:hypothetical protein
MTASDLTVIALCVYLVGIIFGCIGIYIHHIIKYKNLVKDYYERGGDKEVISFEEFNDNEYSKNEGDYIGGVSFWPFTIIAFIIIWIVDGSKYCLKKLFRIPDPRKKTIQELREEYENKKPKFELFPEDYKH